MFRPFAWLWARRVWISAAVGGLMVVSTAYVLWAIHDLPDPSQNVLAAGDVVVLDRNGKLIEDWSPAGRYHLTLTKQDMGRYAPTAVLAAEDRTFYKHGAIDVGSTARAAWVDVTTHSLSEGGSTITQQLVKIQLLTPEKSINRKIQELTLAVVLEQRFSKDQILTMYLNRVYFGHGAYGIGAAARTYFNKDATDLTAAQAAFLAGLIQAPSTYDPATNYDLARARQLYVIQGMVDMQAMTDTDAALAANEDIKSELHIQASARQSKAPHFVDYVLSQLEKSFGSAAIQQGGLVVHTTLDLDIQKNAEQAVTAGIADLAPWSNINNAALLAANPKNGEILAWVGSADYSNDAIGGQFDVVLSKRSPGSSFKPYVYEAALRDHTITWATVLHDALTNFNGYTPRDFDNGGMGDIPASTAILYSRNIPAVQVAQMEGITNVITLAHAMGIKDDLQPYLSTAIGASDITLFEHVQGYETFANQGQRMDLNSIREVDDALGNTLYKRDPGHATTVLSPAEAYLMTDVLKHYQYQWGFGWNRQMASKTGTSDNGKGQIPDSWIMAYNPDVVAGVWVGNTAPNGGGGFIRAFGESVGQTIMRRFVNSLPASDRDWFTQPGGVEIGSCSTNPNDPFLPGSACPTPSPTPSPASSARTKPSPTPPAPKPTV